MMNVMRAIVYEGLRGVSHNREDDTKIINHFLRKEMRGGGGGVQLNNKNEAISKI